MKKTTVQDYRVLFDAIPWEQTLQGVRQKAVVQGGRKLRLVEYDRAMPLHWCVKGHYGFILYGRFEIEFSDRTLVFEEGDGVFIPEGEEHRHRARVLTDGVRVVFVEDA